ncbi:Histidinol-phosphate aminotransferase 2 [compost metagenome]
MHESYANYVLFQSPRAQALFDALAERGILIRNVSSKRLPNALRVTVGSEQENILFLKAMTQLLS